MSSRVLLELQTRVKLLEDRQGELIRTLTTIGRPFDKLLIMGYGPESKRTESIAPPGSAADHRVNGDQAFVEWLLNGKSDKKPLSESGDIFQSGRLDLK